MVYMKPMNSRFVIRAFVAVLAFGVAVGDPVIAGALFQVGEVVLCCDLLIPVRVLHHVEASAGGGMVSSIFLQIGGSYIDIKYYTSINRYMDC